VDTKKGIPFPAGFSDYMKDSSCNIHAILWYTKKKLPMELRGTWRVVEEAERKAAPFVG
jgi:hypothetical protein